MKPSGRRPLLCGALVAAVVVVVAACVPPPAKPKPPTYPPVVGCPLAGAAFCENFEGSRNISGNRNGDWSTARFSAARWHPSLESDPDHVEYVVECQWISLDPSPHWRLTTAWTDESGQRIRIGDQHPHGLTAQPPGELRGKRPPKIGPIKQDSSEARAGHRGLQATAHAFDLGELGHF